MLRKELQDRLEQAGYDLEWQDVINDLDNLIEMQITMNGKSYIVRSEAAGTVGKVTQACKVKMPEVLRELPQEVKKKDV